MEAEGVLHPRPSKQVDRFVEAFAAGMKVVPERPVLRGGPAHPHGDGKSAA